jgi:glucose/arabinose dehydrogenase
MRKQWRLKLATMFTLLSGAEACARVDLPPGFTRFIAAEGLDRPTSIAFASDGRMFVAEQRGVIRVFIDGTPQPQPFLDLSDEVGSSGFRGLLGIALDPQFEANWRVYLAYTVDQVFGPPEESDQTPTFNRVARYTGTAASNGNVADPSTRTILIGATPSEGIPACWAHTIDCVRFGRDGSLLVSCGDGGHYEFADAGGNDPACFQPPYFGSDQDLGAFRSQYLGSMNGKILRIDPATGLGLSDNPYWDGDAASPRSRIWAYGFRNPFRFCVQPGPASLTPGTLFIGDVGWHDWEEINVASGAGLNFGWPCYEGFEPTPRYPDLKPASSGCETIGTPVNPGSLTQPLVAWNHSDPTMSVPPGPIGANAIGGAFYDGLSFPLAYRGGLLFGDYAFGWIRVLKVDASNQLINFFEFASDLGPLVDIAMHPVSGDVYYAAVFNNRVYRIAYSGPGVGDINGDGVVDIDDLLLVIGRWGPCAGGPMVCPSDIDGSGAVNIDDLLAVISHWG